MSDMLAQHPLLAAAPIDLEWPDPARCSLAALPCLGGVDLRRSAAYLEGP